MITLNYLIKEIIRVRLINEEHLPVPERGKYYRILSINTSEIITTIKWDNPQATERDVIYADPRDLIVVER